MTSRATADAWDDVWNRFDARPVAPVAARPRRRAWLGLLALPLAWFAGPVLIAGDILRGPDSAALTDRVDWAAAIPALAVSFRDSAGRDHGPGASRFLDGLAQDMAAAWQRPEARSIVLADRGSPRLEGARLEDIGRLTLGLGRGGDDAPSLRVTMSMTAPLRLGWAVTGLRFSDAAAPVGSVAQAPLRPRMIAF
ncbi:hypothetical protein ACQW02_21175 [Humitalea sp. 24SJ18S-53]|uniref:hypothetical protein n=1 Tax=Humitalea sp. 24SJ18S-53 TaxID=3422307 RepID=UPI003D67F2CE